MRRKIGTLIPHLPAEVGHRRLRASTELEEQRLHKQGHRQDAREEQDGFEQGGRLSVGAQTSLVLTAP